MRSLIKLSVDSQQPQLVESLPAVLGQNRIPLPKFTVFFNKISSNVSLGLVLRVKIVKSDSGFVLKMLKPSTVYLLGYFIKKDKVIKVHELYDLLRFNRIFLNLNVVSLLFLLFGYLRTLSIKIK
jgi:ribosomal protein L11